MHQEAIEKLAFHMDGSCHCYGLFKSQQNQTENQGKIDRWKHYKVEDQVLR